MRIVPPPAGKSRDELERDKAAGSVNLPVADEHPNGFLRGAAADRLSRPGERMLDYDEICAPRWDEASSEIRADAVWIAAFRRV